MMRISRFVILSSCCHSSVVRTHLLLLHRGYQERRELESSDLSMRRVLAPPHNQSSFSGHTRDVGEMRALRGRFGLNAWDLRHVATSFFRLSFPHPNSRHFSSQTVPTSFKEKFQLCQSCSCKLLLRIFTRIYLLNMTPVLHTLACLILSHKLAPSVLPFYTALA